MNEAKTTAALVVYALVFGFTSGTIISGVSVAFALVSKDPRNNGTYMGMGLAVSSFAALIGPPVNGALVDRYGGFFQVSVFSGVVCLFGGCLAATAKVKTKEGIWGRV
jgi:MFS family permease